MGDLAKCLDDLVTDRALTRDQAEEVLADVQRRTRRNAERMALPEAERRAADEALAAKAAATQLAKLQLARLVLAQKTIDAAAEAHPKGLANGYLAHLTKDGWGAAKHTNVEYRAAALFAVFNRGALALFDKFAPKAAGFVENVPGYRAIVRELFGEDSGDAAAKAAAKAWSEVAERARMMFNAVGGAVGHLEVWRLPQAHDGMRIHRAGEAAWSRFVDDLGVEVYDDAGIALTGLERMAVLKQVFETLSTGGLNKMTPGAAGLGKKLANQRSEHRVLHFTSADAWLQYHERFGQGSIYGAFAGHLHGLAKDIAALEILGPNPVGMIRYMKDRAAKASNDPAGGRAIERTWMALSGSSELVTARWRRVLYGMMQNTRDLLRSAQMGSAVISSTGDFATVKATADWNGLSSTRVLAEYLRQLNPADASHRALATRLGLVADATIASMHNARVSDGDMGRGLCGKLARATFAASGLDAHTHGLRSAFQMEFMAALADHAGRSLDELAADNPALARALQRGGLDAALWDAARAAPMLDVGGARFVDPLELAAADGAAREAGLRLHALILQESDMAVPMPDARVRGMAALGTKANTLAGELVRMVGMYRTFPMTVMLTHGARALSQSGAGQGQSAALSYGLGLFVMMSVAGMASTQARQILLGKDPRDMTDWKTWGQAVMQGGGLGILGDFFGAALSRTDKDLAGTIAGTTYGLANDVLNLTTRNALAEAEGIPSNTAGDLVRFLQSYAPGSNLWYARTALDRLAWSQLRLMVDPTAPRKFSRMERKAARDYGQEFWWRPGESAPDRLPAASSALGVGR